MSRAASLLAGLATAGAVAMERPPKGYYSDRTPKPPRRKDKKTRSAAKAISKMRKANKRRGK